MGHLGFCMESILNTYTYITLVADSGNKSSKIFPQGKIQLPGVRKPEAKGYSTQDICWMFYYFGGNAVVF